MPRSVDLKQHFRPTVCYTCGYLSSPDARGGLCQECGASGPAREGPRSLPRLICSLVGIALWPLASNPYGFWSCKAADVPLRVWWRGTSLVVALTALMTAIVIYAFCRADVQGGIVVWESVPAVTYVLKEDSGDTSVTEYFPFTKASVEKGARLQATGACNLLRGSQLGADVIFLGTYRTLEFVGPCDVQFDGFDSWGLMVLGNHFISNEPRKTTLLSCEEWLNMLGVYLTPLGWIWGGLCLIACTAQVLFKKRGRLIPEIARRFAAMQIAVIPGFIVSLLLCAVQEFCWRWKGCAHLLERPTTYSVLVGVSGVWALFIVSRIWRDWRGYSERDIVLS